jgi:hypothetical protein
MFGHLRLAVRDFRLSRLRLGIFRPRNFRRSRLVRGSKRRGNFGSRPLLLRAGKARAGI